MLRVNFFVVLASVVVLAGCAPGRMADLRDSGRLSLGLGFGISADAKVGALTHPSFGILSTSAMLGFDSRDIYGEYYEARVSEPYATVWARDENEPWLSALNDSGWRAAFETRRYHEAVAAVWQPVGQSAPDVLVAEIEGTEIDGTLDDGDWVFSEAANFNTLTDFQLGATLFLVSARAGVNVLEFIDFLLGFGGVDIAGDDQ